MMVLDTSLGGVDLNALTIDEYHEKIDELERLMFAIGSVEMPIVHRFTPGMYIREMHAPAGALITSLLHKTEHPFVVSKGRQLVFVHGQGWIEVCAPYTGITKPGTRRIGITLEDTVWTTFHATDCTDPESFVKEATVRRVSHRPGMDPDTVQLAPVKEEGGLVCHS